ncbi:MAG: tol-pal system protein YbgF [Nitrospira sp.]|uniref:TPR repeat containing exported protein periplasmic protein contains a protein prenylyltransferase domain n=1 Tax=Nitrospira defluvii TaxID=330214 RepID=A0ABN7LFM3_9BACT|nr:tol-pal system protein YbgF [Nitrospira defluvii]MCS6325735.1 tol-pal system protein YbgF [Nitrospira sp.]CAE6747963.1 putative TPR repeat containing exported protein periplasmic protein contains a protein prenylyltransferase domain [Nitrospira defluvii]
MDSGWPQRSEMAKNASIASLVTTGRSAMPSRLGLLALAATGFALLSGCVAQQADLKQTERELQRRIKQQTEEQAQTRARQNQEIISLREQDIPSLRGDLDKAMHRSQVLESRQDDLLSKLASQESKFERRIGDSEKRSLEESKRLGWVEKQLVDQDALIKGERDRTRVELAAVTSRLDQVTSHIDAIQKNVLDAMQKTTTVLAQKVDSRLDDQQKLLHGLETRSQNISQLDAQNKVLADQVTKFNQALIEFKQVLNGLGERVVQQDQAVKHLAASLEQDTAALGKRTDALAGKIEADNRVTAEHFNEVNRSVASVAKALENAGGKFVSREDDHERRLEETTRELTHVQAQIQTIDKNLENQHAFLKQVEQHLVALRTNAAQRAEQPPVVAEAAPLPQAASVPVPSPSPAPAPAQDVAPSSAAAVTPRAENRSAALMADRESYERTLTRFKDGDLDGARQGFAEFLVQHPHSDLAPNARFWLGESYYGKKDYSRAIDAYDQVQLNHPASEKVPAALLKKGYAYLALKDRKKAASALKQVIDLYPRSPEANKAMDKLNQLKESH